MITPEIKAARKAARHAAQNLRRQEIKRFSQQAADRDFQMRIMEILKGRKPTLAEPGFTIPPAPPMKPDLHEATKRAERGPKNGGRR